MDDGYTDEPTAGYDIFDPRNDDDSGEEEFDTSPESDPWPGVGARRGPRSPAEGVRIIGAEEAAAAIESGQATPRSPDDVPRYGDVPEAPREPRPPLRFPGVDPAAVAKPPVASTPPPAAEPESRRRPTPARDYVEDTFWGDPDDDGGGQGSGSASPGTRGPTDETISSEYGAEPGGDDYAPQSFGEESSPLAGTFREELEREGYMGSGMDAEFEDDDRYAARPVRRSADEAADRFFGSGGDEEPAGAYGPADAGTERTHPATDAGYGGSLPHWTEPPSGEVPRILPDSEPPVAQEDDDDLRAWATLSTGPRWRDQEADWDESELAGAEILDDPEMRVGALRGEPKEEDDDLFPPEQSRAVPPVSESRPGVRRRDPRLAAPAGAAGRGPVVRPRDRAREFTPGGPARGPAAGAGPLNGDRGHELQVRVVTGAIVLAVLLLAAAIGPGALTFLVAIALVMAAAELYQSFRSRGYHPATLLGLAATAALVAVTYWKFGRQDVVIVLLIAFSLLWYLLGVSRARPLVNSAVTVFGFFYVGFLGSYAVVILKLFGDDGVGVFLGAILATAAYDTGAYFVGRWTGRTPLMPDVSPGKTVEGLGGGVFGALVICLLGVQFIAPWSFGKAFWLAVVVSVAAPLGDLCESLIKRDLDIKDMGTIVRGHGGVLDRIDALLFVMPATYYLLLVLA